MDLNVQQLTYASEICFESSSYGPVILSLLLVEIKDVRRSNVRHESIQRPTLRTRTQGRDVRRHRVEGIRKISSPRSCGGSGNGKKVKVVCV